MAGRVVDPHPSGVRAIYDVGLSYFGQAWYDLPADQAETVSAALTHWLEGKLAFGCAASIINAIMGDATAMQKLTAIVDMPIDPIPSKFLGPDNPRSGRNKTRPWIVYEDQRLLAAIYRFGLDSWISIASFVGNGRTRSQCFQRWNRGLDPRICKGNWMIQEETRLMNLVKENGEKSWTKIAQLMGNRSDVQCRYRYYQMRKDQKESCVPAFTPSAGQTGITTHGSWPKIQTNVASPRRNSLDEESSLTAEVMFQDASTHELLANEWADMMVHSDKVPRLVLPAIDPSAFIEM
jgi:hypothetical protein